MLEVFDEIAGAGERTAELRRCATEIDIGRVAIAPLEASNERCIRTQAQIELEPDDCYLFIVAVRGQTYYSQGGQNGVVEPGGYLLINRNRFFELCWPERAHGWTVRIPGRDLRNRIPDVDEHCGRRFANNRAMGRIAFELVKSVADTFAECRPPHPEALATELIDIIALVIGAEADGDAAALRTSHSRLRRRIFEYIQRNLADHELTPRKIAESNRISLSYLYRLFSESSTTVGQFVQNQRLQLAYELLVSDTGGRLTVAEIAYRVGFKNASHFSRSFSHRFQMAPRDARQARV